MKRLLLALPLLLAACGGAGDRPAPGTASPSGSSSGSSSGSPSGSTGSGVTGFVGRIGLSDPLREPARAAPFEFGRTETLAGNPNAGARAAAEIEAFAHAAETDPNWTHPRDAALLPKLQIARREMRGALGLPSTIPPPVAIRAFATAVDAMQRYDDRAAIAALAPVGGAATLERLGNLPRLPRVEEAMQAVAIEVNTPQLGN